VLLEYFNKDQLQVFPVTIVCSVLSGYWYVKWYVPQLGAMLTFPEGRYGPPMIREEFVILNVFFLLFGVVEYLIDLINPPERYVTIDSRKDYLKTKGLRLLSLSLVKLGVSLIAMLFTELVFGGFTMNVFNAVTGLFISLRPSFHSFSSLLNFSLFYHCVWISLSQLFIFSMIHIAVECLFGTCFHLTVQGQEETLLSGLKTSSVRQSIQAQAYLEFYEIVTKDPSQRFHLMNQFIGEVPMSKQVCHTFIDKLQHLFHAIDKDVKILRSLEQILIARPTPSTVPERIRRGSPDIIKKPSNVCEGGIIKTIIRLSGMKAKEEEKEHVNLNPKIPSVLSLKAPPKEQPLTSPTDKNPSHPILKLANPLSQHFLGRFVLSAWILLIKYRHIRRPETIMWVIQGISRFVVASFDEDQHGQVQYCLDPILCSLVDLLTGFEELLHLPAMPTSTSSFIEDVFESNTQLIEHCSNICHQSIQEIVVKFGDALANVNLSPSTRTKLLNHGFLSRL